MSIDNISRLKICPKVGKIGTGNTHAGLNDSGVRTSLLDWIMFHNTCLRGGRSLRHLEYDERGIMGRNR